MDDTQVVWENHFEIQIDQKNKDWRNEGNSEEDRWISLLRMEDRLSHVESDTQNL